MATVRDTNWHSIGGTEEIAVYTNAGGYPASRWVLERFHGVPGTGFFSGTRIVGVVWSPERGPCQERAPGRLRFDSGDAQRVAFAAAEWE